MIDKLEPYDIFGTVIPGVLLTYWFPICFPAVVEIVSMAGFPEAIDVIGFVAIAIVLGQLVQALGSLLEGALYFTWGGKPSQRALSHGLGDRYLSKSAGNRIRASLVQAVGEDASDQELFQVAFTRAHSSPGNRLPQFNALYAYHRGLVVVLLIGMLVLIASRWWGAAGNWPRVGFWVSLGVGVLVLVVMWFRAKQRAFYLVREALYRGESTTKGTERTQS